MSATERLAGGGVIHDLTRPLVPQRPGEWDAPEPGYGLRYRFRYRRDWSLGDNGSQAELLVDEHYGTHVDAPRHVVRAGPDAAGMDLARLIGEAVVLDCRAHTGGAIDDRVLDEVGGDRVRREDIVLLCSDEPPVRHGELPERQTHLVPSGAEWLVAHGVRAVGVETIGLEHVRHGIVERRTYEPGVADPWPAHRICLENDVYVVEGLTGLAAIVGRRVTFVALPLRIAGGSGSPVRAVALTAD